ncbi:hypothetical protein AC249_AIPGENE8638 [Exaiptasia diaphana]|nr:hypothetical protein AC249_AIPGENE8638 [Exaiptasia diaphana]
MKTLFAIAILFISFGLLVQAETNQEAKRLSIKPPRPIPSARVYLPGITIEAGKFKSYYSYCYCFRFKCHVPGMHNGFKGWLINQNNRKGYFVINGRLYIIYRCDHRRIGGGK